MEWSTYRNMSQTENESENPTTLNKNERKNLSTNIQAAVVVEGNLRNEKASDYKKALLFFALASK